MRLLRTQINKFRYPAEIALEQVGKIKKYQGNK